MNVSTSRRTANRQPPRHVLILLVGLIVVIGFQTVRFESSSISFLVGQSYAASQLIAPTIISSPSKQTNKRRQIPLSELTRSDSKQDLKLAAACNGTNNLFWVENTIDLDTNTYFHQNKIPSIIHQTSKSRCLYGKLVSFTRKWSGISNYTYSHYLHDDAAVWRLINRPDGWPEFPHLQQVIQCVNSMTAISDVWRYLILWEYGGIYSDLDSIPNSFDPHRDILPNDDCLFVLEYYDAPSQYWMAVSPKHPIMYYAIQHSLSRLLTLKEIGNMDASLTTGPFALLDAMIWFGNDAHMDLAKPIKAGFYQGGRYNRTVRIIGSSRGASDQIITRDALGDTRFKQDIYQKMNMTHFSKFTRRWRKSRRTCMGVLYNNVAMGAPDGFQVKKNGS